jgi:ubiquinone/menaquinone biosynthesis C-methylase UbiE
LTGVDVDVESVRFAQTMAAIWAKGISAEFQKADAGSLPFDAAAFDLVVARLLLPYVRIEPALDEMARVLKAPGMALLQVHSPRYYATRAWTRLAKPAAAFYYLRPLISGFLFATLRRQPRHPWLAETALGAGRLTALCARRGLKFAWRGGFRQKPLLAFVKPGRAA